MRLCGPPCGRLHAPGQGSGSYLRAAESSLRLVYNERGNLLVDCGGKKQFVGGVRKGDKGGGGFKSSLQILIFRLCMHDRFL